jgi:hypothetical protein
MRCWFFSYWKCVQSKLKSKSTIFALYCYEREKREEPKFNYVILYNIIKHLKVWLIRIKSFQRILLIIWDEFEAFSFQLWLFILWKVLLKLRDSFFKFFFGNFNNKHHLKILFGFWFRYLSTAAFEVSISRYVHTPKQWLFVQYNFVILMWCWLHTLHSEKNSITAKRVKNV